jgi:HEAT repeat protein
MLAGSASPAAPTDQAQGMGRRTIGIAILALILLTGCVGGYVLYIRSEAYLIGVARGHGPVFDRTTAMTALFNKRDPERVVPVFVELLGDEDATIREKAAEDLGFMRAKAAVEALIAALPKQGPSARKTFIEALGAIGDARAAPVLLALLGSTQDEEAYTIAVALAKLGPDAVPLLLEHLADPKWAVRAAAAAGLGWIGRDARPDLRREIVGPIVAPLIPLL